MIIGLYFGSFNPIHHGHLIIANQIINEKLVDEIWFVVSPQNPFKKENSLLNANHRFHLVQLAIEGENKFKASRVEFNLPKPSYTADTMIYLKEKYPDNVFKIIIGSDSFQNLDKWKNAEQLIKNYEFIVYKRPGVEIMNHTGANFESFEGPLVSISSSLIRGLIKNKKSIRFLVPDIVADEIKNNNFYVY